MDSYLLFTYQEVHKHQQGSPHLNCSIVVGLCGGHLIYLRSPGKQIERVVRMSYHVLSTQEKPIGFSWVDNDVDACLLMLVDLLVCE